MNLKHSLRQIYRYLGTRMEYRSLEVELSITSENYEAAAFGRFGPPSRVPPAILCNPSLRFGLRNGVKGESASGQPDCVFISDY